MQCLGPSPCSAVQCASLRRSGAGAPLRQISAFLHRSSGAPARSSGRTVRTLKLELETFCKSQLHCGCARGATARGLPRFSGELAWDRAPTEGAKSACRVAGATTQSYEPERRSYDAGLTKFAGAALRPGATEPELYHYAIGAGARGTCDSGSHDFKVRVFQVWCLVQLQGTSPKREKAETVLGE